MVTEREYSSFRDPSGYIYYQSDRILRAVMPVAADDFEFVRKSGLLDRLVQEQKLLPYHFVDTDFLSNATSWEAATPPAFVLEHPRVPFISYPYEWCFHALRDAARLQLDLYLSALEYDVMLSDASAYNIQFNGSKPIFIDHLSFRRYRIGEAWGSHQQFCDQFLNPLLLRFLSRVAPNHWYKGDMEGIPTSELNRLIPLSKKFSWRVFIHVVLQAKLLTSARKKESSREKAAKISFDKNKLMFMLRSMRTWITKLTPPPPLENSDWSDYADNHSYQNKEEKRKQAFVADFCQHLKPKVLWDLGCNTGDYAILALHNGAGSAVGLDFDTTAVEKCYLRAKKENLNLFPLVMDMTNPSPDQGWGGAERKSLKSRVNADAVIALALVHHLAIGKNIPLAWVIANIVSFAPNGVIEFVPKTDAMVQKMLLLRDDIFPHYTQEEFAANLKKQAKIIKSATISETGRCLYWYAGD